MNVCEWAETHWRLETGELVRLRPWQRRFLETAFPPDGSPSAFETFLLSLPKKTAKTETNAIATAYAGLTLPAPETLYCVANDFEQARERVFERIGRAFRAMGLVKTGAVSITGSEILLKETGTRIVAIPADYAGIAGALFGVSSWTELWAYVYEHHVRLWEELTPIPNRLSLRFVDSYAGFDGQAPVLEPLWKRALEGEQVAEDTWTNGRLWALIGQGEEARPRYWLGRPEDREPYYTEQAATLRPGTFARLHSNIWQSGEEAFVTSEQWDACVVPGLLPLRPGESNLRLTVGVDAATKQDCAAVVAVAREPGELLRLCAHRIWTPRKGSPLDLTDTIVPFILELQSDYGVDVVVYDPTQMAMPASVLGKHGLRMRELPQGLGNLTLAGQSLWQAITSRRLRLYADPVLRQHALNAVAVETPRGWKLAKEKAARKIDGAAALSFAVLAASEKEASGVQVICPFCGADNTGAGFGAMCGCSFGDASDPVVEAGGMRWVGEQYVDVDRPRREQIVGYQRRRT